MRGVDWGASLLGITASGDVGFFDAVQQSPHILILTRNQHTTSVGTLSCKMLPRRPESL